SPIGVPGPTRVRASFCSAVSTVRVLLPPFSALEDGDGAGAAVDPDALAGLDLARAEGRPRHGGEAVLPAHDGGVAHHPADVGDRGPDLAEDRGPRRGG